MIGFKSLFQKRWNSLDRNTQITDPQEDYKTAKRIGQYRAGDRAVYRSDGYYLPYEVINSVVHDKGSVHVTGC